MQPSTEIADIIRGWFNAVATADPSWVDRHASKEPDARLIGTDPSKILQGSDVGDFLRASVPTVKGRATVTVGHVEGFVEGDVGWGFGRPALDFGGGDTIAPRWTAVFHREDGEWKLVQLHVSMAPAEYEAAAKH